MTHPHPINSGNAMKLGIMAFSHPELDIFALYKRLFERGWVTSLCTQPKALHLMLSPFHETVVGQYLTDLTWAVAQVRGGITDAVTEVRYS